MLAVKEGIARYLHATKRRRRHPDRVCPVVVCLRYHDRKKPASVGKRIVSQADTTYVCTYISCMCVHSMFRQ